MVKRIERFPIFHDIAISKTTEEIVAVFSNPQDNYLLTEQEIEQRLAKKTDTRREQVYTEALEKIKEFKNTPASIRRPLQTVKYASQFKPCETDPDAKGMSLEKFYNLGSPAPPEW